MKKITLLRHGRSQADDDGVFESRFDSPLTSVGEEQARKVALTWKNESRKYETVVSSTLSRARRTAEIFGEILGIPVEYDEGWLEIDAGELCGLPKEEGMKRFPMKAFQGPYDRIAGGSGESEAQIHARALLAIESLVNTGGDCLVVSHGAFLNAAVRMALGIPVPVNRNGVLFRFGDCGYMDLAFSREIHRWVLLGFTNG